MRIVHTPTAPHLFQGIQADAMIPIAVPALVDSYVECWKYFAVTLANRQAGVCWGHRGDGSHILVSRRDCWRRG